MGHDKGTLDQLKIDRTSAPGRTVKPRHFILPIVILVLLVLFFWWNKRSKSSPVRTALARESVTGGLQTLLNASGYVTPRREATVSSKVTGKVIEVLIEEGMRVEAGQILARLDSSNVEASLRMAQAQLESARKGLLETRVRLEEAEIGLRRTSRLAEEKIAPTSDLDRVESEVKLQRARLEKQAADITVAETEVALWKQQVEDNVVRAPFAGIVTAKNAQPGEMISPMSSGGFTRTGICTIVDMNSLEIEVDVNESYINRILPAQRVEATLDAYPGWKIPTKVIAIIPTADRQKATVKVRVGFEKNDPRILPQMGVKVAFQSEGETSSSARSIFVPSAALRSVDGRDVVWVVKEGRLERRAVTLGSKQGDETVVTGGLNSGEKVILEPAAGLQEGSRVTEEKQ